MKHTRHTKTLSRDTFIVDDDVYFSVFYRYYGLVNEFN